MKDSKGFFRGCLLGGAVADSLGYPAETLTLDEIRDRFGADGIQNPVRSEITGKALISDATQMTVFTVDGLLWADSRARSKGLYAYVPCVFYAYQKWYFTQTGHFADKDYEFLLKGEVLEWEELFVRRAPETPTLDALAGSIRSKYGTTRNRINSNKGCGAVARTAPVGMHFLADPEKAFQIGIETGALTHGHPDSYLTAGFFAGTIALILSGLELEDAITSALQTLKRKKEGKASFELISKAVAAAASDQDPKLVMEELGEGWAGEEAMARGLYCALKHSDDFESAVRLAVNQNGNSSDPAAICGNLLGASLGSLEIPYPWIRDVELSDLMVHGSDKLLKAAKAAI